MASTRRTSPTMVFPEATLDGQYYPNQPGARTIRDAKPLYVDNHLVTAGVGGNTLTIFVGCKAVYDGPVPAEVTEVGHVNPFIQQYIADWCANN